MELVCPKVIVPEGWSLWIEICETSWTGEDDVIAETWWTWDQLRILPNGKLWASLKILESSPQDFGHDGYVGLPADFSGLYPAPLQWQPDILGDDFECYSIKFTS